MFNLLDAVSYEGCGSEADGILSALFKGGSCVMSTATRLARASQYVNCISYKTKKFHNAYLDWKNEPQKKKDDCEAQIKIIENIPKIINKYHEKIEKISKLQNRHQKQLEAYIDELKNIELLRKKQLKMIKTLKKNQ